MTPLQPTASSYYPISYYSNYTDYTGSFVSNVPPQDDSPSTFFDDHSMNQTHMFSQSLMLKEQEIQRKDKEIAMLRKQLDKQSDTMAKNQREENNNRMQFYGMHLRVQKENEQQAKEIEDLKKQLNGCKEENKRLIQQAIEQEQAVAFTVNRALLNADRGFFNRRAFKDLIDQIIVIMSYKKKT
jgi:hypothetical protein